jgi:mycothiol synthase
LDETQTEQLRTFLREVAAVDGRPEVVETGPLPGDFRGGRHVFAKEGDRLVGYGHLDEDGDSFGRKVAEVFVHPDFRRQGIATSLVTVISVQARPSSPDKLRVWAHGNHPAGARIAQKFNFGVVRELDQMSTTIREWPQPTWPAGVRVRAFQPGADEEAVIAVNADAFSWHPEQGSLTVPELVDAEQEKWFDPAGFFLAVNDNDDVLGFHWTKRHSTEVGEVYVVGVSPQAQGGGLGKALTLAGLNYLAQQGVSEIILYVESDNAPALAVYEKLGFGVAQADIQYANP